MKVTTGIKGLDRFLSGGFNHDTVVMVTGIKKARDTYVLQFINKGIYVSTEAVDDVMGRISGLNMKIETHFIAAQSGKRTKNTDYVESLAALEQISMAMDDLVKKKGKPRVVINLLSTLMLYNELERIVKFLQTTIDRCKAIGVPLAVVVDEDMHNKQEFETLKELCNVVVNFMRTESGNFLQVRNDCPASLLQFSIEKRGIVLEEQFL